MKKILLHSCCAPCSVCVIEKLKEQGLIHLFVEFRMKSGLGAVIHKNS